MIIKTWLHQDINEPVKVNYLNGNLFTNNGNGNQINVLMTDKGEPVNITGTVSGYVVTADGSTVPCVGGASGNRAAVLIPAAAYQPGPIFITVFVTDGTQVTTIGAVSSIVLSSRTNAQVDPGSVVTDWTQTINAAMQAVQTAAANMSGIIAVPYASITFPVPLGKYTVYNDNLYRCITPIASSESFTAAHWTQVRLGDDVSDLKSALNAPIHIISEIFTNCYDKESEQKGCTLSYNSTTNVISIVSDSRYAISNKIAVPPGKTVFPCGVVNGASERSIANSCRSYYITNKAGGYVTHGETMTGTNLAYTNNTSDLVFAQYIVFINHPNYTVTDLVICVADSAAVVPYKTFGYLKYQEENDKRFNEYKEENDKRFNEYKEATEPTLIASDHGIGETFYNAYDKYAAKEGYGLSLNATTHVLSFVQDDRYAVSNKIAVPPGKTVFPCGVVNGASDRSIAYACRAYFIVGKDGLCVANSDTMTAVGLSYTNNTTDILFAYYIVFINHSSYTVTDLVIGVADTASIVPYKPFGYLKYQDENDNQINEIEDNIDSICKGLDAINIENIVYKYGNDHIKDFVSENQSGYSFGIRLPKYTTSTEITANGFALQSSKTYQIYMDFTISGINNIINDTFNIVHGFVINNAGQIKNETSVGTFDKTNNRIKKMISVTTASDLGDYKVIPIIEFFNCGAGTANVSISMNNYVICESNDYAAVSVFEKKAYAQVYIYVPSSSVTDLVNQINGDEVFDKGLYQDIDIRLGEFVDSDTLVKSLTFLWVSDFHCLGTEAHEKTLMNMVGALKYANIRLPSSGLIDTGDIVNTTYKTDLHATESEIINIMTKYINLMFSVDDNYYYTPGNHDGKTVYDYDYTIGFYKMFGYKAVNNPTIHGDGIRPYYYVDYADLKLRMIYLAMPDGEGNTYGPGTTQLTWLANTALNTPNDYSVILVYHIPASYWDESMPSGIGNRTTFTGIISAYHNHTTFSDSVISCDFSGKSGTKVVCSLCGHTHFDSVANPGEPWVNHQGASAPFNNGLPCKEIMSTWSRQNGGFNILTYVPSLNEIQIKRVNGLNRTISVN